MAPSPLAWLLRLAAFFHLCTLLPGEWVPDPTSGRKEGYADCISLGKIGPRESQPSQWLLGWESERHLGGVCGRQKLCGEESEG